MPYRHHRVYTRQEIYQVINKMSTVIFVSSIIFLVGFSFTAIAYLFSHRSENATVPISRTVSLTPAENTVPFSYNVPADSHMDYKNDVVIVVEHPDDKIAVGVR